VAEDKGPENAQETTEAAPGETGGASRGSPAAGPIAKPAELASKPVDAKREDARKVIAYVLLGILIGQLIFFGGSVFGDAQTWERSQEFIQVTLAGTLGLLGSAIGFYFGSQR